MTLRREAAADLFQELFARLAGSAGFAAAEDFPAFAYRAAINLAHDWRRRQRRVPAAGPLPPELPAPNGSPVDLFDRDEVARVLDAVAELGSPARDAVCLRYLMQMSYADLGRVLGRSAHAARALCHAGIVRVRRILSDRSSDGRQVNHVSREHR